MTDLNGITQGITQSRPVFIPAESLPNRVGRTLRYTRFTIATMANAVGVSWGSLNKAAKGERLDLPTLKKIWDGTDRLLGLPEESFNRIMGGSRQMENYLARLETNKVRRQHLRTAAAPALPAIDIGTEAAIIADLRAQANAMLDLAARMEAHAARRQSSTEPAPIPAGGAS